MKKQFIYILLACCIVVCLANLVYTIVMSSSDENQLFLILSATLLVIFAILFTMSSIFATKEKGQLITALSSLGLTFFVGFNLLVNLDFIKLPTQPIIKNLSNESIVEAMDWANSNKIDLAYTYEFSDTIEKYYIIAQDIEPGTLTKKVDNMTLMVSDGPNYEKTITIPNMTEWTAEEILTFIKANFLINVDAEFIISDVSRHTLISQSFVGEMKRNDNIKFVISLGTEDEQTPLKVLDFKNMSLFEATYRLNMYGIKFNIDYKFSDSVIKNNVISQSIAPDNMLKYGESIALSVSKGIEIIVPDVMKMTSKELMEWTIENRLTLKYSEKYDEKIKKGYPISVNVKKDDKIEEGALIDIVSSKGQLEMQEFTDVTTFSNWAKENEVAYDITYEFSNSVAIDQILSISLKIGDIIKNGEHVTVVISKGQAIEVPNLVGMSESAGLKKCRDLGFVCSSRTGNFSDSVTKGNVLTQSISSGTNIGAGSTILLTISKGKEIKIIVPNFVGMTWSNINTRCGSLGLTCNNNTGNYNSSYPKDTAYSQNVAANSSVSVGTTVTVTLSRGTAQSTSILLNSSCFNLGSFNGAKSCLQGDLSSYTNNGYIFSYKTITASEEGPGKFVSCSEGATSINFTATQGSSKTICIGG